MNYFVILFFTNDTTKEIVKKLHIEKLIFLTGKLSLWVVLVKLVFVGIVDTMMYKLVLVCVEKIMNNEKIYERGEETYLGIARLWTHT